MQCPLMVISIHGDRCPVTRCMYRRSDHTCAYGAVEKGEQLSVEEIAALKREDGEVVAKGLRYGLRRLQTALTLDAYLDSINVRRQSVNSEAKAVKEPSVLRVFGITRDDVPEILDRERYAQWQKTSGACIPFEDIELFVTKLQEN